MNTLYKYTFLLLSLCLLAACSDDNQAPEEQHLLTLLSGNTDLVVATTPGEPATITFTATTSWTAKSDQSWCSVVPASGTAGTIQASVIVQENATYDQREALITLQAGTAEPLQIKVTQVQKDAILVAKSEYEVGDAGGTLEFEVNTNMGDFAVSSSADWVERVPDTRGLQAVQLTFHVQPNTDAASREAVITLSKGEVKQEVKIFQEGYIPTSRFSLTHTNSTFSIPLFLGDNLKDGTIQWGDQQTEAYSQEAVHTYADPQAHTVVVEIRGAEEVRLPDLVGVTAIDLTEF